jgi:PAS domain S-box-containing protein
MKNAKILIIEDKNSATMSIKSKLQRLGYTVLAIESSEIKAIKDSGELKPDLILMDINSNEDYITSVTKIRDCCDSSIIYLTAHFDNQTLDKIKLRDPHAYIVKKQLSDVELKSIIENALNNCFKSKLNDNNKNLNAFLNSVNEPAFLINLRGNILFTNEYTNKTLGNVLNSNIYELLPPNTAAYRKKYVEIAIKTKKITRFEDERYGKNYEYRIYPILDEKNEVFNLSIIGLDVTKRKISENALKESEERFKAAFENAAVGMTLVDINMNFIQVNQTLSRITGYSKEELISTNFFDIVYLDDLKTIKKLIKSFIEEKKDNIHFESRCIHKKGNKIWVDANISLLHNDKSFCFIAHIQDITERKFAENERKLTVEFLNIVTKSQGTKDLIHKATTFFKQQSGCDAARVRLQEGNDYPCFKTYGFSNEFILAENELCARDSLGNIVLDKGRNPVIECMCGNVICRQYGKSKLLFTAHGSFWTNSTTELLASTTEADRQDRTRNMCSEEGYESVALIPLHVNGQKLGLLQLNHAKKGAFSPDTIGLWERMADQLTVALVKFRAEDALLESEEKYRSIFENSMDAIFLTRPDGSILDANPAAEEMYGYTKDELCKSGRSSIVDTNDPNLYTALNERIITGKFKREFNSIKKTEQNFLPMLLVTYLKTVQGLIKELS